MPVLTGQQGLKYISSIRTLLQSRGPTKSDGRWGWVARENQEESVLSSGFDDDIFKKFLQSFV